MNDEYDSPWKEVIEDYFPDFIRFFFPQVYRAIDWNKPYEFLDQELQQLEPDGEIGKRLVDKVAKVWLVEGQQVWILVHVEVQGKYETIFPERMYCYNYRLYDRHHKPVISLAVLADSNPHWRPNNFSYNIGGCQVSLEFPVVKLLDYESDWETLEETTNPFGIIVMAHLKTRATHKNPASRLNWKLSLVRRLYEGGYNRSDVVKLFRFIDWIMFLPPELARGFKAEVRNYEEVRKVRYVTSIERLAREEGIIEKGREDTLEILSTRFGSVPNSMIEVINGIEEQSVLNTLFKRAITIGNLGEFQQLLEQTIAQ
ncbi:MAG: transposase [Prochloron sp. SP5CPC1]|nr:transposase [Candidatus Paraprochloron terpiosi SP5CPC1]